MKPYQVSAHVMGYQGEHYIAVVNITAGNMYDCLVIAEEALDDLDGVTIVEIMEVCRLPSKEDIKEMSDDTDPPPSKKPTLRIVK